MKTITNYETLLTWCRGNGISLYEDQGDWFIELKAFQGNILICRSKGPDSPQLYKEMQRYIIQTLNPNGRHNNV